MKNTMLPQSIMKLLPWPWPNLANTMDLYSLIHLLKLRHFGHILDNRYLSVGGSTLTPSDVTSEPITQDPTIQLTKVSSTLWANSVPTQVQYPQCGDVTQCLCQVRCSLSINMTCPQSQFSEDSVPPQGRCCSRTQHNSHYGSDSKVTWHNEDMSQQQGRL